MVALLTKVAAVTRSMGRTVTRLESVDPSHELVRVLRQIYITATRVVPAQRDDAVMGIVRAILKRLFQTPREPILVDSLFALLARLGQICDRVALDVNYLVQNLDHTRKFDLEMIPGFVKSRLLNVREYDAYLAKMMQQGQFLKFGADLVRRCVIEDRSATPADLPETLSVLARLARDGSGTEREISLQAMFKQIQQRQGGNSSASSSSSSTSPATRGLGASSSEEQMMHEQVSYVLDAWMNVCVEAGNTDRASYERQCAQFLQSLQGHTTEQFFSAMIKVCAERTEKELRSPEDGKRREIRISDAFARLVVLLLKQGSPHAEIRLTLFKIVIEQIAKVLLAHYDAQKSSPEGLRNWNQRIYFRIFVVILQELRKPDPQLPNGGGLPVLKILTRVFHSLRPSRVGAFAFAWLELISHRSFMPKLLSTKSPPAENGKSVPSESWSMLKLLLVDLFEAMAPYLEDQSELKPAIRELYNGTLRVLLVLLHDFPEFLCDYHFAFCDVIPSSCIQLRNLILSAFPRAMRLPDPFTPDLKVDLLPEISQPPRILSDFTSALQYRNVKQDLDMYMQSRSVSLLTNLTRKLLSDGNSSSRYNIRVMNALVLYVGTRAISELKQNNTSITSSPPMSIFQHLSHQLDAEGRYHFLNAMANQLRYPNSHSYYFSCAILFLFSEAKDDSVKEQITRVLLERLIVHRPHPWSLLCTLLELIRNKRYKFWSHSFTQCATEIERLFESVARSCMGAGERAGQSVEGFTKGSVKS